MATPSESKKTGGRSRSGWPASTPQRWRSRPTARKPGKISRDLLPIGSTVTLKVQTKDRYGRTVAEVFTQNGANAGLTLVQQGHAFADRQYLKQCDAWAYLDREKLAERYRLGVWRSSGGIERPWDWRVTRRGGECRPRQRAQRPVNLTIINGAVSPRSGRRWYCRTVGSWEHAQQLLREGHTYLDGDSDGEACVFGARSTRARVWSAEVRVEHAWACTRVNCEA